MLADYRSGAIDEAGIVYSAFQIRDLAEADLRAAAAGRAAGETESRSIRRRRRIEAEREIDYLIEPTREELVPVVLRGYLEAACFMRCSKAEASEQGARMTAMDSATNNADDMISSFTLEMNRARQAQITRELMDIVGGAEALRG